MSEPKVRVEFIDGKAYRLEATEIDIPKLVAEHARHSAANERLGQENAELRDLLSTKKYDCERLQKRAEHAEDRLIQLSEFTIALGEGRVSLPGVNDPLNMTEGIVKSIIDPQRHGGAGIPVDPLKRYGVQIKPRAAVPHGRAKREDA